MKLKLALFMLTTACSAGLVAQTITVDGHPLDPTTSHTIVYTPQATPAKSVLIDGRAKSTSQQHSLVITPGTAPVRNQAPTASLQASPSTVKPGGSTTLTWSSTNATSATLNGASVATSGSQTLTPTQSMNVNLAVQGSGQTATATAAIVVEQAQPAPPTAPSTAATAPHIDYTDLNVGSGSGGDEGNGVYVRIFGHNFGSSQGGSRLTLGSDMVTNCAHCSWTDTTIIAQVGPSAVTGNIVVNVNGQASNGASFTVAPTTILFVANSGSDNNSGSFTAPFKSWRAAFNAATSGDNSSPAQNTVIYFEPGTCACSDDGRGYRATVSTDIGGTSPIKQLALVGYPGGQATIGSLQVDNGIHGWAKYLTVADLTIIGRNSAIDAEAGNIRVINNDLSCPAPPNGLGGTACFLGETETTSDTWTFQGNTMHNTGGNVDKTYHAVYFSTGVNHADVSYNSIGNGFQGYCRSLMFHASSGANLSDLHAHDNFITGGYCDGIDFGSVDPSQGTVEAYNNVIIHTAIASNPYGVANEVGIAVNTDPAGSTSGNVLVYNNTVVDAGGYTSGNQNGCFGVVAPGAGMSLTNNICVQPASNQPYVESKSQGLSGSNNLWFGAGPAPSWDSSSVTVDPQFVGGTNFALQSGSPAARRGTSSRVSIVDFKGITRSNPPSVGAFE